MLVQALVSAFNDLVAFNTDVGGDVCAAVVIEIVQANASRTSMRHVSTAMTIRHSTATEHRDVDD
jgi:hypothetical protein